jgi:hypothetical protein
MAIKKQMGDKAFSASKYDQAKIFLGSTIKGIDYSDFLTVIRSVELFQML